ncbi:uncharacterized protein PS065_011561 [Dugong dugon]
MKIDHLSTALPGYVNARRVRRRAIAARAEGYLGAPVPSPAPCTPPSPPSCPPRPGRALTPGLGWQTPRRARRGRRAERRSPGRRGARVPGPGRVPAPLPPLRRCRGSGGEEARCWRTGFFALSRAHRAWRLGCGRDDSGAADWRSAGPRPLWRRRGPQRLLPSAVTCMQTPRAARAGAGNFAERGSNSQCAGPFSAPQESCAGEWHLQGRHRNLPASRRAQSPEGCF